jgi:DNA-directed RNA polymerase subunit RPC12/RpoP
MNKEVIVCLKCRKIMEFVITEPEKDRIYKCIECGLTVHEDVLEEKDGIGYVITNNPNAKWIKKE